MNYAGKFDARLPIDGTGAHVEAHRHIDSAHAPSDAIIVSDAHLLFNGDFKRSGTDLILSRDDNQLVLHDYFKGEKRAALSSPDGAHLTGDIINALTGHQQFAQADGSASVAKVIGHVTKLVGTATAIRNGVAIILNNGDNVEKGDVVQSGSGSTLGLTFIDGTVFGLSSNARMVLNEMIYDPNGSNNSSLLSLVAGTISFVAGETAKHGDMKVDTPVATMGIRGTAVLVEIDFDVPQNGVPNAKFQVLVEPDGRTGSYILYDKTTLTPIATVDQAGVVKSLSNGILSSYSAPLSDDVQKLITDVFALKFTDNTNTKSFDHQFADSIIPQSLPPIKLADGASATPIVLLVNTPDKLSSAPSGPNNTLQHIAGPPLAVIVDAGGHPATSFAAIELAGKTNDTDNADVHTIKGQIYWVDVNAGDVPSAKAAFSAFTYKDAHGKDVGATLNGLQLADIKAVEAIKVDQDPGNINNGSATWTYKIPDGAFDFLAAGETLTLTYTVEVDNNYGPSNEAAFKTFTITITGTNDAPVINTGPPSISFSGGTTTPGGDLTPNGPTSGTLSFTDVDLTDTHSVSTKLAGAVLSGPGAIAPGPLKIFEAALGASIAADSTGTGNGTISWNLADLPVYLADFIPKGETLTLTYAVTVTDSQGATSTQNITVTITGTAAPAVVWIATVPAGSPPGGFWSNASNWETGTVPTLNDDVIIITDQLRGLTPSYPVTIDAAASAKSVTMNDFGTSAPQLINESTLTISGVLSLAADSIVDNRGTISVGGLMEVSNTSVLQNSGQITLAHGGDFRDHSTITNTITGKIELAGGTLNVQVDIANAGHVTVDTNATLTLSHATITGGTVTNAGVIDLTGAAVLKNGALGNSGEINVSGTGNALDNEIVSNAGGLIEVTGALTLDHGTAIAGGTLTNSGFVKIETAAGATLDGVSVGNGPGIIQVDDAAIASTLIVDDGTTITGGTLTIGAVGTLEVKTASGATLDGVSVGNSGVIQVDAGSQLNLNGLGITGGMLTNDGTIDSTGITAITDVGINNVGTIEATSGVLKIDPDTPANIINSGVIGANGGELDITGEPVTNTGTLRAIDHSTLRLTSLTVTNTDGNVAVGSGSTLDLVGAKLIGGTLSIDGTLDSTGGSAVDGAIITNTGLLESTAGTLTIDAASIIHNTGTLEVNGGNLIVDTGFSGNAEIVGASLLELGASSATAYSSAHISFADAATGTLRLDHAETFHGTISGLDDNSLDLGDITSGSNTTITYSGDSGMLTIVNNADGEQVAHIHLTGDYTGSSFTAASDGHGGTIVTEVPGAIAGLDSHGNAIEGTAVTALITDGGRSVSNATYEWQIFDNAKNQWVDGSGAGVTSANYIPGEQDEGHALRVKISFADAVGNVDHGTISAGTVNPVADRPVVTASATAINEDGTSHLTITLTNAADLFEGGDDSVTVTVSLSDGAVLHCTAATAVTHNADGTFTLTAHSVSDLGGLTITPASEFEGSVAIDVSAVTHDGTAVSAPGSASTALTVNPVADPPVVTAAAAAINENGTSALTLTLTNADHLFENAGDSVTVTVSLSDGAVLHGTETTAVHDNGNGTFTLTAHSADDLNGLTVTPVSKFEGRVAVGVSAMAHDGSVDSTIATTSTTLTVNENPAGDLVATLDSMTAKQGVAIHVTGVTDGGTAVTAGLSYAWQHFDNASHSWVHVGTNSSSYTPGEGDEGKALQLVVTHTDATGSESSTYSLGMANDLTATLDSTTAKQGVAVHVTSVKDGGTAVSKGLSYEWQVSSDGHNWTTVGSNASSYTPVLADDGKSLQVVVGYTDAGENENTTVSVGTVAPAKVWNGGSHDWQSEGQWTPSGAPTANDDVVVAASGTARIGSHDAVAHSLVENGLGATVEIVGGHTLTLGGDLTVSAGVFQIDSGATLKDIAVDAAIAGIPLDNGTIEAAGGRLEISGAISLGKGSFQIDAGATLQLDHADVLNVSFAGAGTLILNDPTHFVGTISRSVGSLEKGDVVDVAGFDDTAKVSYLGTASGGAVLITEAKHTPVLLQVGQNSTKWSNLGSDGHGGILIHDPPADAAVAISDAPPAQAPTVTAAAATDHAPGGTAGGDIFVFNFAELGHEALINIDPTVDVPLPGSWTGAKPPPLPDSAQDAGAGHSVIAADVHDTIMLSGVLKAQLSFTDFHTV